MLITSGIDKDDLFRVFGTFGILRSSMRDRLKISNIPNITGLLLLYSSPLQMLVSDLAHIVESLNDSSNIGMAVEDEESNDIEEFTNWLAGKIKASGNSVDLTNEFVLDVANDLLNDIKLKSESIDYIFEELPIEEQLFQIVRCRLLIDSVYTEDINIPIEIIETMSSYNPFSDWYNGIYTPCKYYWDSYGRLATNDTVRFHEICQLKSSDELFNVLITPLNNQDASIKPDSDKWIFNVILPVFRWKQYDFHPLYHWLILDDNMKKWRSFKTQKLWKSVIISLIQLQVPYGKYDYIVEGFLTLCYYDAVKKPVSEKQSSLETLQTFDLIKETAQTLIPIVPKNQSNVLEGTIEYDDNAEHQCFDSYSSFAANTSLKPLLRPYKDCLILLSEMMETCANLYPINQTTASKYLMLKYSKNSNVDDLKKECSKILVGLRPNNASQLLKCLDLFKSTFAKNTIDIESIDNLVVDRLLFNNLYQLVEELYKDHKLGITNECFIQLLFKKFWESVNNSNSFDDRLGKLRDAASCIQLLDLVASDVDINAESRSNITKSKHLMKVFSNIKNFKIILGKSGPTPTPNEILKSFGTLPSNEELRIEMESASPMGLISIILTHNPKSYVAFEKLFKVVNDFLIFLDDTKSESSYYFQRLMAACIEAALLDNNFIYAHRKSVELLDRYSIETNHNLNNMWMTFYQVGNYHSPDWYNGSGLDSNKIDVLQKQSEILAKYLLIINRTDVTIDNSRIIVEKWVHINNEIELWYDQVEHLQQERRSKTSSRDLQENITATANEIMNDAANTTNQASEKLSNLFVSGLGWAIGANSNH